MFGTRTRPGRRAALALALSVLLHVALAVGLWVYELASGSGFELPRREYAVEIVGVSEDSKPAAAPEAKPPEEKKAPEKAAAKEHGPKEKQAAPPRAKAAKPAAPKVTPPPPSPDDAPVVAKDGKPEEKPEEPKPTPPEAEDTPDKPAIPWPLDEPEAHAATTVDLPGSAPGDAALLVAFRLDRLRGTPWAAAVERILAPMPDYETIIAGGTTPLAEMFDLLFIATPDVRDVTATFLAAHHQRDEAELEKALTGSGARPRVTWAPAAGGTVGARTKGGGVLAEDPRVFLVPEPGWIVLARPEHLPGMLEPLPPAPDGGPASPTPAVRVRPRWMERMVALVGDPGAADAPAKEPIAIFALARLPRRLVVPGVGIMPAPQATVISVFADAAGLRVVGALDFADENAAAAFVATADRTRDAALGSLITRHFINQVNGGPAVEAMRFAARGKQVAVTTTVPAADAAVMIDAAVAWTTEWFSRHGGGE